jgi:hypothetical protein
MCGSIRTSLTTFLVSSICMGVVWFLKGEQNHIRFLVLFVMTFASMQLVDAALWQFLDHNGANILISKFFLPAVLIMEVLVSYYGAVFFLGYRNIYFEIFLWLYIMFFITIWLMRCKHTNVINGYLKWCGSWSMGNTFDRIMFIVLLLTPILLAYPNTPTKVALVGIISLAFVRAVYDPAFGTKWCWLSNMVSVAALILVALGYK